ncbi:MAG: 4-(cytidine 5'-diphospho)-2-C-methyl-D-erythritol kinase [Candidatus Baltobacteraceae bacterium]
MEASKSVRAPAKLNLTLEVLRKRPDGLHALRSVMVPVDLCDELTFTPANGVQFRCDRADLLENNLAERALRALPAGRNVDLFLEKSIPTGAGMGGGSSDAAAVLLAMGGEQPAGTDFLRIARSLGSDVPFFLTQSAALVEGAGERVTALGTPPPWHAVIVKPPVSVSTRWAYERLDAAQRESRARSGSVSLQMGEALQRHDFEAVTALLQNDFHDVIVRSHAPIAQAANLLIEAGAPRTTLTGSGSCIFTLAQTAQERDAIARRVRGAAGFEVFACAFYRGAAWRSAA